LHLKYVFIWLLGLENISPPHVRVCKPNPDASYYFYIIVPGYSTQSFKQVIADYIYLVSLNFHLSNRLHTKPNTQRLSELFLGRGGVYHFPDRIRSDSISSEKLLPFFFKIYLVGHLPLSKRRSNGQGMVNMSVLD
jgi:hypothetical protein